MVLLIFFIVTNSVLAIGASLRHTHSTHLTFLFSFSTDKNECATNNGGCQHYCANSFVYFSLKGVLTYAINYRVKKIGWFKTTPDGSKKRAAETEDGQCFQNPVYDVSKVVKQETSNSHDNSVYQMADENPDREI